MKEIIYFLSVFGLTNAIVFLHVGKPIRELITGIVDEEFHLRLKTAKMNWRERWLGRLIHCHACSGFYCGLIIYPVIFDLNLNIITYSLSASAINFILWVILMKIGVDKL